MKFMMLLIHVLIPQKAWRFRKSTKIPNINSMQILFQMEPLTCH